MLVVGGRVLVEVVVVTVELSVVAATVEEVVAGNFVLLIGRPTVLFFLRLTFLLMFNGLLEVLVEVVVLVVVVVVEVLVVVVVVLDVLLLVVGNT